MLQLSAGQVAAEAAAADAELELDGLRPVAEADAAGRQAAESALQQYAADAERAGGRASGLEQACGGHTAFSAVLPHAVLRVKTLPPPHRCGRSSGTGCCGSSWVSRRPSWRRPRTRS